MFEDIDLNITIVDVIIILALVATIFFSVRLKSNHLSRILIFVLVAGLLLGVVGWFVIKITFDYEPGKGNKTFTIDEKIRLWIPLLASIITSISLIIATYNIRQATISSRNGAILDLIKFSKDIIADDDISSKSKKILDEINTALDSKKSDKFRYAILANNGAREIFKFLNKDDEKARKRILKELDELKYSKNQPYSQEKDKFIKLITSSKIEDMRTLWIIINFLAGHQAVKYKVLKNPVSYMMDKELLERAIERDPKRKHFYTDVLFFSKSSEEPRNIINDLIMFHAKTNYKDLPIRYFEVYRVCNEIFEKHYEELGHFFRTTHRTLKMINKYYKKDTDEYKVQIGLLRAQIPNDIAILLFYNATYSEKGRGMARELIASNFFGDKDDFKFNKGENNKLEIRSQHLANTKRLLNAKDAHIAHTLYAYNTLSAKVAKKKRFKSAYLLREELVISPLFDYELNIIENLAREFAEYPISSKRHFSKYNHSSENKVALNESTLMDHYDGEDVLGEVWFYQGFDKE